MTAAGHTNLWIAPIHIDTYLSWSHSAGRDPATASTRAGYAAEPARTGAPQLIAWPPARNAPCWCGSGRKYKKCCGHPNVTGTPS